MAKEVKVSTHPNQQGIIPIHMKYLTARRSLNEPYASVYAHIKMGYLKLYLTFLSHIMVRDIIRKVVDCVSAFEGTITTI